MVKHIISNLAFSVISVFGIIFGLIFVFFGLRGSGFIIFASGFLILLAGSGAVAYLLTEK